MDRAKRIEPNDDDVRVDALVRGQRDVSISRTNAGRVPRSTCALTQLRSSRRDGVWRGLERDRGADVGDYRIHCVQCDGAGGAGRCADTDQRKVRGGHGFGAVLGGGKSALGDTLGYQVVDKGLHDRRTAPAEDVDLRRGHVDTDQLMTGRCEAGAGNRTDIAEPEN